MFDFFSEYLAKKCATVVAVDCDPPSIKACQDRGIPALQLDLSSGGIDSLLAEQAPFDAVVAMDVLEHLARPQDLLARLYRLMDRNGRLMMTGPNVVHWHTRWNLMLGRWNYAEGGIMDETHSRWFTRATWRKLLEESGFESVVDQVVDSHLPKEYQFRTVPGFGRALDWIKQLSERAFPNLIAMVFLFCCQPVAD